MNPQRYRERLIDEVKKYPVLYDTGHEHHRDIDVRDRCWQEISDRLGSNCDALKREWKILRDSMRQAIRRSKRGATTKSGEPCKKWRFQNRMAFVLPYITVRPRPRREMRNHVKVDAAEREDHSDQEAHRDKDPWDPPHAHEGHEGLELFFASVCQAAKRLSTPHQNKLKKQVLEALLRAEEDHDTERAESKEGLDKTLGDIV